MNSTVRAPKTQSLSPSETNGSLSKPSRQGYPSRSYSTSQQSLYSMGNEPNTHPTFSRSAASRQPQDWSAYSMQDSQGTNFTSYPEQYPTSQFLTAQSSGLESSYYQPSGLGIDTGARSSASSTQHRSSVTGSTSSVSPMDPVGSFYRLYSPRAGPDEDADSPTNDDYSVYSDAAQTRTMYETSPSYSIATSPQTHGRATPSPNYACAADGNAMQSSSSNRSRQAHVCTFQSCDRHQRPFARYADLQRHLAHVHYPELQPRHDCIWPDCRRRGERGFARRDHMLEHVRNYHHIDLPRRTPGRTGSSV
ncbi:hypothetical protein EV356DRAFT_70038 [Viridothelium virens]|uniref:C2H2-type domain-containing protein n=1 Tax=Viridothelium virens TaxID=1048519 RepID=A0A6A6HEM8_VIRVR|nr:hypothetical protein EV356DRAFT_70038 [Viridothelium virens]